MGTHNQLVDGKQTLALQENALNFAEQNLFAKVTAYAEVAGTTNNQATLEDVPIGQQPGPLHLEKADDDTQADNVKVAGKTEIFRGKAFVESKEKIVLGFR